ncbi:MAG: hypothetical protein K2Q20_15200 [Phycisphaerales bacterium]|nr:hypothetical protein [Phycisphaerales bacterium]
MSMSRQNVLIQTHAARQQAAELLKQLEASLAECQAQLKAEQRIDHVKLVTGKSSLETAIAQTQRMLESLDRALEEARNAPGDDAPAAATPPAPPEITIRGVIGPALAATKLRFA